MSGIIQAAPIQRYSDPRLFGTCLVKPFEESYEWIRTVSHPWHPKCNAAAEISARIFKVFLGIIAIAITIVPALIGRCIQMINYHLYTETSRNLRDRIFIDNTPLPDDLIRCDLPSGNIYCGTSTDQAISILRWGFDPKRAPQDAKLGEAIYLFANDSNLKGPDQLFIKLDLKREEVAYFRDSSLQNYQRKLNGFRLSFLDSKVRSTMREQLVLNGIRALKFELPGLTTNEAWAILDPCCITITSVQTSLVPMSPADASISLDFRG